MLSFAKQKERFNNSKALHGLDNYDNYALYPSSLIEVAIQTVTVAATIITRYIAIYHSGETKTNIYIHCFYGIYNN